MPLQCWSGDRAFPYGLQASKSARARQHTTKTKYARALSPAPACRDRHTERPWIFEATFLHRRLRCCLAPIFFSLPRSPSSLSDPPRRRRRLNSFVTPPPLKKNVRIYLPTFPCVCPYVCVCVCVPLFLIWAKMKKNYCINKVFCPRSFEDVCRFLFMNQKTDLSATSPKRSFFFSRSYSLFL